MNGELKSMENEKQKLLDKIRKLLALSKDPANEHEAAAAGEKARQLLDQYNLTVGELDMEATPSCEERVRCSEHPDPWLLSLFTTCDFLFATDHIICPRPYGLSFIAVCGLPQNVAVAIETVRYFAEALRGLVRARGRQLVKRGKRSKRANARRVRSFKIGAAMRIGFEARELKRTEQEEKLVLVGNAIARRHMDRCYPRHKAKAIRKPKFDQELALGYEDGAKVNPYGTRKQIGATQEAL
jgi:hypothetical protein